MGATPSPTNASVTSASISSVLKNTFKFTDEQVNNALRDMNRDYKYTVGKGKKKKEYSSKNVVNMFNGTRNVKSVLNYLLMRGVTDFGNLQSFNLYESGYSFFVVMAIPRFMAELANTVCEEYSRIIQNYAHILEFENRGLSGIDNMSVETGELTNGINSVKIINKVNKPTDSTYTATYQEKLGSTLTKAHEIFLTGIKDPRTQVKTYLGVLGSDSVIKDVGYQNEVFHFMYIVCDNSLRHLERAMYLTAAQVQGAQLDIYNSEKGTYEFKEINVEFTAYPVTSQAVNILANNMREHIYSNTNWLESTKLYSISERNNNFTKSDKDTSNTFGTKRVKQGVFFFNNKETNTKEINTIDSKDIAAQISGANNGDERGYARTTGRTSKWKAGSSESAGDSSLNINTADSVYAGGDNYDTSGSAYSLYSDGAGGANIESLPSSSTPKGGN